MSDDDAVSEAIEEEDMPDDLEESGVEPTQEEIMEYAAFLGIDPVEEPHLMWIAREGVAAPVPPPWEAVREGEELYYHNRETSESIWDHPCDAHYRKLLEQHRSGTVKAEAEKAASEQDGAANGNTGAGPNGSGAVDDAPRKAPQSPTDEAPRERSPSGGSARRGSECSGSDAGADVAEGPGGVLDGPLPARFRAGSASACASAGSNEPVGGDGVADDDSHSKDGSDSKSFVSEAVASNSGEAPDAVKEERPRTESPEEEPPEKNALERDTAEEEPATAGGDDAPTDAANKVSSPVSVGNSPGDHGGNSGSDSDHDASRKPPAKPSDPAALWSAMAGGRPGSSAASAASPSGGSVAGSVPSSPRSAHGSDDERIEHGQPPAGSPRPATESAAPSTRPPAVLDHAAAAGSGRSSYAPSEVSEDFRSDWGAPSPPFSARSAAGEAAGGGADCPSLEVSQSVDALSPCAMQVASAAPLEDAVAAAERAIARKELTKRGDFVSLPALKRDFWALSEALQSIRNVRIQQEEYLRMLKVGT